CANERDVQRGRGAPLRRWPRRRALRWLRGMDRSYQSSSLAGVADPAARSGEARAGAARCGARASGEAIMTGWTAKQVLAGCIWVSVCAALWGGTILAMKVVMG